jgi:hypothetical protein
MVPMSPHALTLEQIGESQTSFHLRLVNQIVSILGLVDDEFTELDLY